MPPAFSLLRLPALLAALVLGQPAAAMTWTWHDGFLSPSGNMMPAWITAEGDIDADDPMRLIELLVANGAADPGFITNGPTLYLDSPGGVLAAGMDLAEIIRAARMTTVVDRDSECHSSCTIAFLGGVERRVMGVFGIHAMLLTLREGATLDDALYGAWEVQIRSANLLEQAQRLAGSDRVIREMLVYASTETRALTGQELSEWGVITHAAGPDQYPGAGDGPGGCGDATWIEADYGNRTLLCGTVETARRFAEIRLMVAALSARPLGAGLEAEQARFEAALSACDGGAALGLPGITVRELDAACIASRVTARHRQLSGLAEYYAAIDGGYASEWMAPAP